MATRLQKTISDKLENRPAVRRVLGNVGWLFWDRLLRMGLGLFVSALTTRMLGPSGYGLINWASAWAANFAIVAGLGLDNIVVRDLIRFPESKNSILGTTFAMKLVAGVIALILSVGSIMVFRPHVGTSEHYLEILVALYAGIPIMLAFDTIDFWYQSQVASQYTVYVKSPAYLIMSFVRLWLIHIHASPAAIAATMLVEATISAVGLFVSYRLNRHAIREWKFETRWMKALLKDSWPVVLTAFAIASQTKIDQLMLGVMVDRATVGQFSAAVGMVEAFGFLPMVIYTAVAPNIIQSRGVSEDLFYARMRNLYRIMFVLFLGIAIPLVFLAKPIVLFMLGSKYLEASHLVVLLGIRVFFMNLGVARSLFLTTENLLGYKLVAAILGMVINVSLNWLLIPRYQAVGSIWAMIASLFVTTFLIDMFYKPVQRNFTEIVRAILTPWRISLR